MIRNLKALLLASMAIAAVSAVTASAASAVPLFKSELANTVITATGDGTGKTAHAVFDAAGGTVTCNEAHLNGTQTGATAEVVTLTAEFTTCTFLGQVATVSMEACDFRFHANGDVDVHKHNGGECEHHKKGIKIITPGCTVIVPEQTGLKSIKYHNIVGATGKKEITAEPNVTTITYGQSGPACPTQGHPTTTHENGLFTTGNAIIKGFSHAGVQTNIEWTP